MREHCYVLVQISRKIIHKGPIDNVTVGLNNDLAPKRRHMPLPEPMLTMVYGVDRPQWIKYKPLSPSEHHFLENCIQFEPVVIFYIKWINTGSTARIRATYPTGAGGRFKNTYELRALTFSPVNKIHFFQCMDKIFCVEFQRVPLKFHTKYLTLTLKDMTFIQHFHILAR